jgi:hypothetical protein
MAAPDDERAAGRLPFREQDRSGGIERGDYLVLQGIGYDLGKIAKSLLRWR